MPDKKEQISTFEKIKCYLILKDVKVTGTKKFLLFLKILAIFVLNAIKFNIDKIPFETKPSFITFLDILILFFLIYLVVSIFRTIIVSIYRRKHKYAVDYTDNLILGIDRILTIVLVITTIFMILEQIGVDFNKLITTFALFAVGTAMIFKDTIVNIIDGIIIMFSDELKLKEYIQIGEYKGKIIDMNFFNIELKTDDGNIVYVPNTKVQNSEIINFSKSRIKRIRNEFYLDFAFFGKIEKLEKQIAKALSEEFKEVVSNEEVSLEIKEIRFNRVALTLFITVPRYNFTIDGKISRFVSKFILNFVHKEKKGLTLAQKPSDIK